MPHFSNECLTIINENKEIKWPNYEKKFLEENMVTIVIQINGKKKELIQTKKDLEESELFEKIKKIEKLNKIIDNKEIKKKIYVKNKVFNIII